MKERKNDVQANQSISNPETRPPIHPATKPPSHPANIKSTQTPKAVILPKSTICFQGEIVKHTGIIKKISITAD
jgi:hypothetical protein